MLAQTAGVMAPGGHERRTSIGAVGLSEVVVKSNADVRALTYCDLKVIFLKKFKSQK